VNAKIQGTHQAQAFTEAVSRSGGFLTGDFFAGLSGYATNNRFQKAVFCGTLIMSRNMGVRDLTEAIYLLSYTIIEKRGFGRE
jgi:hypothetical protein